MPNSKSSKKRLKQAQKRTEVNKARKTRVKTFVRKVEDFIKAGKKKEAEQAMKKAEAEIARGSQKGIMKKNTAARKTSRLVKRVKAVK